MTSQDKQMIDQLFQQLRSMQDQSAPQDPEAQRRIADWIRKQPDAPYYMAQLLLLQKESLANAKAEVEQHRATNNPPPNRSIPNQSRHSHTYREAESDFSGQSFLAGAAQVALGVGGGLLLAEFVGDMLGYAFGDHAYSQADSAQADVQSADYQSAEHQNADSGGEGDFFDFFGGDGDWGDFFA
ncbi:MAG: DUF2076 family protein [Chloroflexota bacterium]